MSPGQKLEAGEASSEHSQESCQEIHVMNNKIKRSSLAKRNSRFESAFRAHRSLGPFQNRKTHFVSFTGRSLPSKIFSELDVVVETDFETSNGRKEKKNVLKELGCRLKSLVYQKGVVNRKHILEHFRKKDESLAGSYTGMKKKSKGSQENNWRRRIYDALNVLQNSDAVCMDKKTISLPRGKKNLCGLLVLKEELFKDLYIKTKILKAKKELLEEKERELEVLKGIRLSTKSNIEQTSGTKHEEEQKLSKNNTFSYSEFSQVARLNDSVKVVEVKQEATVKNGFLGVEMKINEGIKLEDDDTQINPSVVGLKIPFWIVMPEKAPSENKDPLLPKEPETNISIASDGKTVRFSSQLILKSDPYFKILNLK